MCCAILNGTNILVKREINDEMVLSMSPPNFLWLTDVPILLSHLSNILDHRQKTAVLPRRITVHVLKGTDVDNVIPLLSLFREKCATEIMIVFEPFTAEEFFPSSSTDVIVP